MQTLEDQLTTLVEASQVLLTSGSLKEPLAHLLRFSETLVERCRDILKRRDLDHGRCAHDNTGRLDRRAVAGIGDRNDRLAGGGLIPMALMIDCSPCSCGD